MTPPRGRRRMGFTLCVLSIGPVNTADRLGRSLMYRVGQIKSAKRAGSGQRNQSWKSRSTSPTTSHRRRPSSTTEDRMGFRSMKWSGSRFEPTFERVPVAGLQNFRKRR
jgi:hypothetical protein